MLHGGSCGATRDIKLGTPYKIDLGRVWSNYDKITHISPKILVLDKMSMYLRCTENSLVYSSMTLGMSFKDKSRSLKVKFA